LSELSAGGGWRVDPGECGVREERGVLVGAGCWQAEQGFAWAARREKGLGLAGCLGHGFGCWAAVPAGWAEGGVGLGWAAGFSWVGFG